MRQPEMALKVLIDAGLKRRANGEFIHLPFPPRHYSLSLVQ